MKNIFKLFLLSLIILSSINIYSYQTYSSWRECYNNCNQVNCKNITPVSGMAPMPHPFGETTNELIACMTNDELNQWNEHHPEGIEPA